MRVCLISAPTASERGGSNLVGGDARGTMGEEAPLGVLSLAAVLEREGLRPEVVDLNRLYYDFQRVREHGETDFSRFAASYFAGQDFDFFGFSTVCSSYPLTIRIACEVKHLHPDSVVAL